MKMFFVLFAQDLIGNCLMEPSTDEPEAIDNLEYHRHRNIICHDPAPNHQGISDPVQWK
jgi:hypothetical protein